jgi:hypothetical protein
MVTRTYIEKINTIISGDTINTGFNPVSELIYGANNTRMLVYFDHTKIKKMYDEKIFADITKVKHFLKITNGGSIDSGELHKSYISSIDEHDKIRATSFDLIFFLIPQEWDGGKGFDYSYLQINNTICGSKVNDTNSKSRNASNWYQARNGYFWEEEGIYSNSKLSLEYDNFSSKFGSDIIIGRQHFDIGNENINLDITDVVNKFISGELENYGIGIAYTPMTELFESNLEYYTSFLTHKTNTFFEPYVETVYFDSIDDDRSYFILDKKNRLYLYCNIGNETENLDVLPTCTVDGKEYDVKQFSKGIYYIDICLSKKDYQPNMMLYDVWDNIIYQGQKLEPIELDFVTKQSSLFFNIGNKLGTYNKLIPSLSGIKYDEKIQRGDVRKVIITPLIEYNKNSAELINSMYARLYIKDGEREIDVIPFELVNKTFMENYFIIDTEMLIPEKYYIDVKIKYNQEMIIHHNVLNFKIVENLNNKYY